ncbi:Peptidyl-tRNA hydrolase [Macleaya cordata]|uniref:peptidyl-tRNA hydrolase n=1 Tax=Macleaya cordata TaxID=56857 RepID=A0A200Q3H7_MACCD|nr:Peptidyl-tRNA hydrolase [Macleaya cordata]
MLDAFAEDERISMSSVSFKALFGKVMLAKPQTTMNASGESVDSIVSYYKIPLEQVVVIYDDYDLPLATLRVKQKGGHGGHNGMRSIIDHFKGFCNFPRLRIGIGSPPGDMLIGDFVLGRFDRKEREELDLSFQDGVEALRILVLMGFDRSAHFTNTSKSRKWQRWVHLTKLHTLIANTKSRAGQSSVISLVVGVFRAGKLFREYH